jgi:hypothetical protein
MRSLTSATAWGKGSSPPSDTDTTHMVGAVSTSSSRSSCRKHALQAHPAIHLGLVAGFGRSEHPCRTSETGHQPVDRVARKSPAGNFADTGRIEASTSSPPHLKSPSSSSDTAATTT